MRRAQPQLAYLLCAAAAGLAACDANPGQGTPGFDAGGIRDGNSVGTDSGGAGGASDSGTIDPPGPSPKQSLVWVWQDFANTLDVVASHASSFTQVSPALYQLNFAYTSGPAQLLAPDFDGLSPTQVAQKIHAAGLKCIPLMYAGAGNSGTDQGIQNVLDDSPGGAQQSFITSMLADAAKYGWDGYNLDWEVGNTDHAYSDKLVSFLVKFRDALHAKGLTLSFDLGGWYVEQCNESGSNGFVDLTTLGASVDWAILEDYAGALGKVGATGCPSALQTPIACSGDFAGGLDVMCELPPASVSIGLISPEGGNGGTNVFAGDALAAVNAYGYRAVAIWPDDSVFLNDAHISPSGATWYSLLADYLKP